MANGNTSPSRLGQVNASGAVDALFLKVFSGEILTTFEETNIMKDLHRVRTIQSGKTAQFPATGIATAKYHSVGENIADAGNSYLSAIKHAEKTISIDDVLISSTFIANIDELKNHYDIRSIYAKELGKALAKRFDIATMKTLAAAARDSATINGGNSGTVIGSSSSVFSSTPTAAEIIDALYLMAENLDTKDVADEGRFAILTPSMYYTLITADNNAVSLASNRDAGGVGNVATGTIAQVAGISLYKSNHLVDIAIDSSGVSTGDGSASVANDPFGTGTGYNADLSGVKILGGTNEAIGTVKLLDLATESEYQIERQGTLFVAKYAMGHGVLRPECAVEVR
tara:strand:+ start:22629 stop:23654 length:1026 start_codon:yes stop_codon:yes gene_type:complete